MILMKRKNLEKLQEL
jgi:hypothetical protein